MSLFTTAFGTGLAHMFRAIVLAPYMRWSIIMQGVGLLDLLCAETQSWTNKQDK